MQLRCTLNHNYKRDKNYGKFHDLIQRKQTLTVKNYRTYGKTKDLKCKEARVLVKKTILQGLEKIK